MIANYGAASEDAEQWVDEDGTVHGGQLDGAELLDELHAFLRRFVAFPSDDAAVAVVLWVAHTHLAPFFDSTPRLALLSPEKQSGKTRTLELLELLCAGAEFLTDASASFVFRLVGTGQVTILLDECDALWTKKGGDETAEALRGIVNSGHRKGAKVGRVAMVGQTAQLERHSVYAPVALAGIGACLPDTILDRSVVVRMRRRAPAEHVEPYRDRDGRPQGEALRDRLVVWCESVETKIGCPWPDMPPGVHDRPADVWEPLLAVADAAGGDWPKRARAACVSFVAGSTEDTASSGVRLLADLREVFGDREAMSTVAVLEQLCKLDEAPWGDLWGKPLDARGLAKRLRPYGVKPKDVRIGSWNGKGYGRADLWDAWTRYLPPKGDKGDKGDNAGQAVADSNGVADTSATGTPSATVLTSRVADVADVAGTPAGDGVTTCRDCSRVQPEWVLSDRDGRCVRCDQDQRARRPA